MYRLTLTYPATPQEPEVRQIIELFRIVSVALKKNPSCYGLKGELLRPSH